ncbi:GTP-binding protein 10 homolog [Athalia rosae]|uniref:GTP-binding protein 10 homolog n=1 Tax=Athalia rosae TaxID=37344 RepID=UPI0020344096|nr:GTP-binding protein 10 homolog [Athalia rosae]
MVVLTRVLGYAVRKGPRNYLRGTFMDSLRLNVKGGTGGMGLPKYGGCGGRGGNVCLIAKEGLTLNQVKTQTKSMNLAAGSGSPSSAKQLMGQIGEDITLPVPSGITILDDHGRRLGELDEPGKTVIVAKGGIGGCPETGFSGQKGQSHAINLDLKLIADVCLVGFPNAGKSTLLKTVSNARPRIAAYPFTTIRPNIGVIEFKDYRKISIADLPGLIEGAHINIGMGHKFLKHVERTKLILVIVDIQGFQLSPEHTARSCFETIVLLNKELELYKPDLLNMPAILVVNKMDTENAKEKFEEISPMIENYEQSIKKFPEEIQPEQALLFDAVLPLALGENDANEIRRLKEKIRYVLDLHAERQEMEKREEYPDYELMMKMKREAKQTTPTLV